MLPSLLFFEGKALLFVISSWLFFPLVLRNFKAVYCMIRAVYVSLFCRCLTLFVS
ncbi:hypothetical protein HAT2_00233 [Candidatus Similichlamydia laticola]|uniref:Uncharacterized protein n=1 Tax=Candidatus Similichlamydia laticola TaxID=2170265 RepID=A0A369KDD8_9BACT|nr:hypothetical protein HAT2_00233 [Candidatus Similichlamydia laticola]